MSIARLTCPAEKCNRARIVPRGSKIPRCPKCEPKQLWLEAEKAWRDAVEKW